MHLEGDLLHIRSLNEAELPTLLKIYIGTPLYFEALGIAPDTLTLDDVRAQWQAVQTTPQRLLLGIEVPAVNLLIGVADLQLHYPDPGQATIWLLLIWGGFQRQGYGQEVVDLLEEWLSTQHGITELRVVAANNEEGLRFWQWRGYVPNGTSAPAPIRNARAQWLVYQEEGALV